METTTNKRENRLMAATLFVFFVSGASSVLLGNLMPYLREDYGFSYSYQGLLLSLPSWGNLVSIFLTGYLPTYIGRRKTVLITAVWMCAAFLIFATPPNPWLFATPVRIFYTFFGKSGKRTCCRE